MVEASRLTSNRKPSPMSDAPQPVTIIDATDKKPRVVGVKRATLAFLFSLLAVLIAAYSLWQGQAPERTAASTEEPALRLALESRMKAQENTLGTFVEDVKKLREDMDTLAKTVPDAFPAGETQNGHAGDLSAANASALQTRLAELEQKSASLQNDMKTDIGTKVKLLAALARTEAAAQKMRAGFVFRDEVQALEAPLAGSRAIAALAALRLQAEAPLAADADLRDGLRQLTPDFLAREKTDSADGLLEKIGVQLQKLIVVRHKNGVSAGDTPVAQGLDTLEAAIIQGDWEKAVALAAELAPKAPKDFPVWQEKLGKRAAAEKALQNLRSALLEEVQTPLPNAPVNPPANPPANPPVKPAEPERKDGEGA
jgi:hypothetical protein